MRIMTSNIWGNYFGNPAHERIDAIEDTFRKYDADVIGIQEMCSDWYKNDLLGRMKDKYISVNAFVGNYTPLLFKKDIFEIREQGWLRYDKTDDASKSVTWAVLKEWKSEKMICVLNTHLWWKAGPEHELIRENNAKQLLSIMKEIKKRYTNIPTVAFGDFNSSAKGLALKYLNENGVYSSYELARESSPMSSHHGDPVRDENGKYRGNKTSRDKTMSIDHIVLYKDDLKIDVQKVVEDQTILDATDHSPVYIDFEM